MRREDEELLGPSEEEQEGVSPGCAKFVRLQHPLMVRMLIQTSLEKIIQKGSTVKVPSMFRHGEDFTIPRFLHHFLFKSWHFRCSRSAVVFPTVPSSIITGLEQLAKVLDNVSWKYWKPGEQPAKILDWMQLRMQDGTCGNT